MAGSTPHVGAVMMSALMVFLTEKIIRNIVRQLETPDRLRGRMAGINMVFVAGTYRTHRHAMTTGASFDVRTLKWEG
jgi:hypothetical protein